MGEENNVSLGKKGVGNDARIARLCHITICAVNDIREAKKRKKKKDFFGTLLNEPLERLKSN